MQAVADAGTVAVYLALATALIVAWLIYKGGGGTALGVLRDANAVLEERVRVLERQQVADAKELAILRGSRDFALAFAPLGVSIDAHEERAQVRFERTLAVLDLIASRLGPDNNHVGE